MLDVEKVKNILQSEVDKREKARYRWLNSCEESQEEYYERRYRRYSLRFDGMCDMLYDLGYLAWSSDENVVFVEKRITDGETSF